MRFREKLLPLQNFNGEKKKKESGELTETEPCERQTGKIFGLEARLAFHF